MKSRNKLVSGAVTFLLFTAVLPVTADESDSQSGYIYKEDWAVISAPPPPGPYRAVNIDPRVPGIDATPSLSMTVPPTADTAIPAEALENPPAAGAPAYVTPTDQPVEALKAPQQHAAQAVITQRAAPPQPGYYAPNLPRPPAQARTAPPRGYGYNRGQQPYGYYGSPNYQQGWQQQVPPPPVYDAMIRHQQPYGYPPRKGTP